MDGNRIFSSQVKVWFSCLFMAGASLVVNHFLPKAIGATEERSAMWVVSLSVSATAGLACYLTLTWLLRCEEMMYLLRKVLSVVSIRKLPLPLWERGGVGGSEKENQ
jgi:hypothetical protein